jgi:hypothetical protein
VHGIIAHFATSEVANQSKTVLLRNNLLAGVACEIASAARIIAAAVYALRSSAGNTILLG